MFPEIQDFEVNKLSPFSCVIYDSVQPHPASVFKRAVVSIRKGVQAQVSTGGILAQPRNLSDPVPVGLICPLLQIGHAGGKGFHLSLEVLFHFWREERLAESLCILLDFESTDRIGLLKAPDSIGGVFPAIQTIVTA